jgi:hypothetical protein
MSGFIQPGEPVTLWKFVVITVEGGEKCQNGKVSRRGQPSTYRQPDISGNFISACMKKSSTRPKVNSRVTGSSSMSRYWSKMSCFTMPRASKSLYYCLGVSPILCISSKQSYIRWTVPWDSDSSCSISPFFLDCVWFFQWGTCGFYIVKTLRTTKLTAVLRVVNLIGCGLLRFMNKRCQTNLSSRNIRDALSRCKSREPRIRIEKGYDSSSED